MAECPSCSSTKRDERGFITLNPPMWCCDPWHDARPERTITVAEAIEIGAASKDKFGRLVE